MAVSRILLVLVVCPLASIFCLCEIWFLADMGYNTPISPLVGLALLAASIALAAVTIWQLIVMSRKK